MALSFRTLLCLAAASCLIWFAAARDLQQVARPPPLRRNPPPRPPTPPPPAATPVERPVRQTFVWKLLPGSNVTAVIGVRKNLYAIWNSNATNIANKWTVAFWLAPQNDSLIGSLTKDATWGDVTGYSDWLSYTAYDVFKTWEKNQVSYKNLPVANRSRVVSYISPLSGGSW